MNLGTNLRKAFLSATKRLVQLITRRHAVVENIIQLMCSYMYMNAASSLVDMVPQNMAQEYSTF